jgi:hypothetical protein
MEEKASNLILLPQCNPARTDEQDALNRLGDALDRAGLTHALDVIQALHSLLTAAQLASARRQGVVP